MDNYQENVPQPQSEQPQYQQPQYQPQQPQYSATSAVEPQKEKKGKAGLVMSVIAIICSLPAIVLAAFGKDEFDKCGNIDARSVEEYFAFALVFGVCAVIFAIVGMTKKGKKWLCIPAIIISVLAEVLYFSCII